MFFRIVILTIYFVVLYAKILMQNAERKSKLTIHIISFTLMLLLTIQGILLNEILFSVFLD